jgi:MerR family transcriptional regulator, light-induced transcriptional regulator
MKPSSPPKPRHAPAAPAPGYRSGAVARMVRMPVATLRVWQRRYRIASPALTPSGQRLYCAADVTRIALLKQLTDLGHAIGSLAALPLEQLQTVAHTHASTVAGRRSPRAAAASTAAATWRVAVVGAPLGQRLQRPAVRRALGHSMTVVGCYATLRQAAAALKKTPVDALLVHDARPDADAWTAALDGRSSLHGVRLALLYRFAAEPLCEQLAAAGVALLREPQGDTALGQWLGGFSAGRPQSPASGAAAAALAAGNGAARRWDDAQLTDFAGLSSTIACECPHHVAELLIQLSHFEAYSAECAGGSDADAQLHGYLQGVASASRALFEDALERVAIHEGLLLPA